MRRKLFLIAASLGLGSLLMTGCAVTPSNQMTKTVIQVSDGDPAKWNLALNVGKNIQQDLGADKVTVEIVAFGPGIGMLKFDAPTANRVTDAVKAGIKIVACENTMTAQKLTPKDMHASIGYVPAGAVEIMKRQSEGWSYLRP